MRTFAFPATTALTALSLWLIFAQASSAGDLSGVALSGIVANAETHYVLKEKSGGLVGLKGDIDACYRSLAKNASASRIVYCIALDDITTRSNTVYGPGAEHIFPYFSAKEFDARATQAAMKAGVHDAKAFKAKILASADPAARRAAAAQHVNDAAP